MIQIMLKFSDRFRQQEVKRWHIVNTTRAQTLAEHAFNVWMIAHELVLAIRRRWDGPIGSLDPTFVLACLTHDEHEVRMGDRPTCAKQYGDTQKYASTYHAALWETVPLWQRELIELADSIEAFWFIQEHGVGQYARDSKMELGKRCCLRVADLCVTIGAPEKVESFLLEVISEGPETLDE